MRRKLPNRRPCITRSTGFNGDTLHITTGYYPEDGSLGEVFVSGPLVGSEMQTVLSDAAIIVSLAIQNGINPKEMAKSTATGSPVGRILEYLR